MRWLVLLICLGVCTVALRADDALSDTQRAAHLLSRFAYGPRPGDVDKVQKLGFDHWFEQQLHPDKLPDMAAPGPPLSSDVKKAAGEALSRMQRDKLWRAVKSDRQLQELMTDFWFNHFNVSSNKSDNKLELLRYERDVIRAHCLGRFRDLLGAVAHSPAMLFYLDNVRSHKGTFKNNALVPGINENYARELMELHTLGVNGGYTQHDIIEVARCLTGWGIERKPDGTEAFKFDPKIHDDDDKVVLDVPIHAGGESEGETVLDMLAAHKSTAHFLSTKLCRFLVADDPPPALVERVATVYLKSNGDIRSMLRTIYAAPEFWAPETYRNKYKTPLFLVVSAMRTLSATPRNPRRVLETLNRMGMPLYGCDPPTGYADRTEAWLSSGGLLERLNFCTDLCQNRVDGSPVNLEPLLTYVAGSNRAPMYQTTNSLIRILVDGPVSNHTLLTLQDATQDPNCDYPHLIALILGSPEFQKR